MNKYKKYMIICICILAFSVVGSTVAYYVGVYFRINASTITYGLDYYINYNKGQNISSATLEGSGDYLGGNSSDIELWKKDNTYDIYGHLYLDIVEIGNNLSNSEALKYTVVNNNNVISEGTLAGSSTGDSVLIVSDIPLQTSRQLYTVYIWLDESELFGQAISNESLSLTVRCEATMKPFNPNVNLISHIKNLYKSGGPELITQAGSNDSYYYSYQDPDNTWGLMNDGLTIDTTQDATTTGLAKVVTDTSKLTAGTEGNIRYFGPSASVKNYIYFNCNDYNNQGLTDANGKKNCELWRIIGIVDGKVKIIKNESMGDLAWDFDKNQNSSLTTYSNNWETASLQLFLNGLYYNRSETEIHTYYSFDGEALVDNLIATQVDLKAIGITDETRLKNLISEEMWYLGSNSLNIFPDDLYSFERQNIVGTTIYSGNPFTINANIGLLYLSDYGYGTDLTKCSYDIGSYNNSANSYACRANNWIFNNDIQWLIAPTYSNSDSALYVSLSGNIYGAAPLICYSSVRPVLYLNSELGIESEGDGTSTDPYRIRVS